MVNAIINIVVPQDWECDPERFNASDSCDCDCGAYDPDCDNSSLAILNCQDGKCLNGTCANGVPSTWICDRSYFNASDGCDCNCGAYDPDCDNTDEQSNRLYNCPCDDMICKKPNGYCYGYCNGYFFDPSNVNGWAIAFGVLLSIVILSAILAIYKIRSYKRIKDSSYELLKQPS